MGFFAVYLLAVGGGHPGAQVARGVVRGAGKLIDGEPRAALAEVAGGVVAPLVSAVSQFSKLGEEICETAIDLALGGKDERGETPAQPPHVPRWQPPVKA